MSTSLLSSADTESLPPLRGQCTVDELARYLKDVGDYFSKSHDGKFEFIPESFTARHGRRFGTAIDGVESLRGPIKMCFGNSFFAALRFPKDLVYVEGFASAIIPVHHAWVIDRKHPDVPIELTWESVGSAYIGVPFKMPYVNRYLRSVGAVLGNELTTKSIARIGSAK